MTLLQSIRDFEVTIFEVAGEDMYFETYIIVTFLQQKQMKTKDKRLKHIGEILRGMTVIFVRCFTFLQSKGEGKILD